MGLNPLQLELMKGGLAIVRGHKAIPRHFQHLLKIRKKRLKY